MKNFTSLNEIHESIKLGSVNCQSLVNYYLERIYKHKNLNVYVEVFAEEALERAKNIDEKLFFETIDRFRSPHIWEKINNKWNLKHTCYKT